MKRKRFDHLIGDPFDMDIDGHQVRYGDCREVASSTNFHANITDALLKTMGGRYIRVTCVGDDENYDAAGILRGWYVAKWLDEETAVALAESWNVDRDEVLWSPPPHIRPS